MSKSTDTEIVGALLADKKKQERVHGTTTMNPMEPHKYLTMMSREMDDAVAHEVWGRKQLALQSVLRVASMAMMCLEQHGLPEACKVAIIGNASPQPPFKGGAEHPSRLASDSPQGETSPQPPFKEGAENEAGPGATEPADDSDQGTVTNGTSETLAPSHK